MLILMVLLLFPACSGEADLATMYSEGRYEELLSICDDSLSDSIDADHLYYKMLCHYRLGQFREANRSAVVFYAIQRGEDDRRIDEALRIILYYNDDSTLSIRAGEYLCSRPGAGTDEKIAYFKALMSCGEYDRAAGIYNDVRGEISDRSAALMCIDAEASSTLIVSNLEAWVMEEGRTQETREAVMEAARILIPRGDGELILTVALNVYEVGDSLVAIMIGDIYAQMGIPGTASTYYSYAYEDYPQMTTSRLRALQRRT